MPHKTGFLRNPEKCSEAYQPLTELTKGMEHSGRLRACVEGYAMNAELNSLPSVRLITDLSGP